MYLATAHVSREVFTYACYSVKFRQFGAFCETKETPINLGFFHKGKISNLMLRINPIHGKSKVKSGLLKRGRRFL